jgi:ligand-binding sensor domain-containing protein
VLGGTGGRLVWLILVATLALAASALGATLERSYVFRSLSSTDGLVQNTVNALHQDRRGFVWIGTQGGLHRYDGFKFRVFQNDPARADSLPDSLISAIDEDENGRIWIGTDGAGVAQLDADSGAVLRRIDLGSDPRVTSLRYVQGVGVWIGTRKGLLLSASGQPTRSLLSLTGDDAVTALELDLQGTLWVGTRASGIFRLQSGAIVPFTVDEAPRPTLGEPPGQSSALRLGEIRQFKIDAADRVLVAASEGLFEVSPERTTLKRWESAARDLRAIAVAPDGAVWVAIDGFGLQRLDLANQQRRSFKLDQNVPGGLADSAISTLLMDRSGLLWIGTRTRGISLTDTASAPFLMLRTTDHVHEGPGVNNVRALCALGADLWVGSEGGTLHRYRTRPALSASSQSVSESAETPPEFVDQAQDYTERFRAGVGANVRINALACSPKGELLIATSRGAYAMTAPSAGLFSSAGPLTPEIGTDIEFKPLLTGEYAHAQVRALLIARDGSVWFGTNDFGLISLDASRKISDYYPAGRGMMPSPMVLSLHQDREGRIWAGTLAGLAMRDSAEQSSGPGSLAGREKSDLQPSRGETNAVNQTWQVFKTQNDPRSLPGNLVRSIIEHAFWACALGHTGKKCAGLERKIFALYRSRWPAKPDGVLFAGRQARAALA